MRPPLLTEDSIRAAIRDVAAGGGRVTGVAVRRLLADRFGARGGVARIYRVIHGTRRDTSDGAPPQSLRSATASDESREAAIARADLAEHRERVHQERWARDTDALRRRNVEVERAAEETDRARRRIADLTRALATAQVRIDALERTLAARQL